MKPSPTARPDVSAFLETLEGRLLLSTVQPLLSLPVEAGDQAVSIKPFPARGDDYGNELATAETLTMDTDGSLSANGRFAVAGDQDVFTFIATVSGWMRVTMTTTGGRLATDSPELVVYNAFGTRHMQMNDTTTVVQTVAGERYYVRASAGSERGTWRIHIATTPGEVPQPDQKPPAWMPTIDEPGGTVTLSTVTTTGGKVLLIQGTVVGDDVTVSQTLDGFTVTTAAGAKQINGVFSGLVLYGFSGADRLRLDASVDVVSVVDGGLGADQIFDNGPGSAYLYGQDGPDLLVSVGGGADVLYGGAGLDSFWLDTNDLTADLWDVERAATVHKIRSFNRDISMEIQGQDLVDPKTTYEFKNYSGKPLFVDGPQFNDVRQGYLGDCYFLAAVGSLANEHPGNYDPNDGLSDQAGVIQEMIAPLGDGSYAVRYYSAGTEVYVRVDGDLPIYEGGGLIFARLTPDGESWVALAEKAYAQFAGNNVYSRIEGGYMNDVYTQVTGVAASWKPTSDITSSYVEGLLKADRAVSGGTEEDSYPILGGHAYVILDVYKVAIAPGLYVTHVTVYNPWGEDGVSPPDGDDDGIIDLTWNEFVEKFTWIAISAV